LAASGDTPALDGQGTSSNSYKLATPEALAWFMVKVKSTPNSSATIMRDISLVGTKATGSADDYVEAGTTSEEALLWPMIGSYYGGGTFDGGGHTVSGVRVNRTSSYTGFFGNAYNATIKNLTLADGSITSTGSATGGIVGISYAKQPGGNLLIENCTSALTVKGASIVAGILGGGESRGI
ncbi:MAG: hypothetical protein ACLSVD_06210, partial [Eggerthellaceae bacterium]